MTAAAPAGAVFEETHRLWRAPWFQAYAALATAVVIWKIAQGDFGILLPSLSFFVLAGPMGYRVRVGAEGLHVAARGALRVSALLDAATWMRLQTTRANVRSVQVQRSRGLLRWVSWPLLGLRRRASPFLGFGTPAVVRIGRSGLGPARIGIRDAAAFERAAAVHLAHRDAGGAAPPHSFPA